MDHVILIRNLTQPVLGYTQIPKSNAVFPSLFLMFKSAPASINALTVRLYPISLAKIDIIYYFC